MNDGDTEKIAKSLKDLRFKKIIRQNWEKLYTANLDIKFTDVISCTAWSYLWNPVFLLWLNKVLICCGFSSVCLSSSSPIFSVLISSDHHQIWHVFSLAHNLDRLIFFWEIFVFNDFIQFFLFFGFRQILRWSTDHVQIELLWVLWGKWPIVRLF